MEQPWMEASHLKMNMGANCYYTLTSPKIVAKYYVTNNV